MCMTHGYLGAERVSRRGSRTLEPLVWSIALQCEGGPAALCKPRADFSSWSFDNVDSSALS